MENLASHVELSYVKNIYTVYHKRDLVLKLKRSWKTGEGHGETHGKSWNVKSSLQTLSLLCILFRSLSRLVCLDRSIPTLFLIAWFVQNNILHSLVQNLSSSKFDEFVLLSFLFMFPLIYFVQQNWKWNDPQLTDDLLLVYTYILWYQIIYWRQLIC